jgi:competence ComEA-like helix-hairpin-helix protein
MWGLLLVAETASAGRLDLNTATQAELMRLGLSNSQALQVIAHREKNGPFLQVEELMAVPQMTKRSFESVREQVAVDE